MLTKLQGIWFGDLDGKRVIIIDPQLADQASFLAVQEFIDERRRNNGRRSTEVLVRAGQAESLEV